MAPPLTAHSQVKPLLDATLYAQVQYLWDSTTYHKGICRKNKLGLVGWLGMGKHLPHEPSNLNVLLRLHVEVGQTQFYRGVLWPLHPHCGTCSPNNNKLTVFFKSSFRKDKDTT